MIPEREREALMRLTMCAREECSMCKYQGDCNFDFQYELATKNMNILAEALRKLSNSEIPNNSTISKMEQVDEPQTYCGDFADRLAYERGVKHAWEVAQKVFNSTVTFYEAEDVTKQIDKDINVRSKDEPRMCDTCRYYNSNIPCGSTPSACKKADKFAEEFVDGLKKLKPKDEPQTDCQWK